MTDTVRIAKPKDDRGSNSVSGLVAETNPLTSFSLKQVILLVGIILGWLVVASLIDDKQIAYATFIAGLCITLWLTELVPPYVPTFLLWALVPLLMFSFGDTYSLSNVLGWSADPILMLFLGGFTLSVAASRYELDTYLANWVVRFSAGRRVALLGLMAFMTAFLSMWMSNIAAAAMMIVALRPLTAKLPKEDSFRRALLLAVALGANLGGMGTPISSGPNAIAMASMAPTQEITFLKWVAFALPLTVGLLVIALLFLLYAFKIRGTIQLPDITQKSLPPGAKQVVAIFSLTIVLWLTEPWHGIKSPQIALLTTALLFGSGLLKRTDLALIDWATLILIAGGLGIGRLLESSGLIGALASAVPWGNIAPVAQLAVLCFSSALLSALMSNTAAATMLIPLAASLNAPSSAAVLIALAASVGIPFIISTPANAMVYGEGGMKSKDLFGVGTILMVLGCVLIVLTGIWVLGLMGL